jgi:GNAT superfamily N-acetyltransferase
MLREQDYPTNNSGNPVLLRGYYPGAIGHITQLHGTYYAEHWGLDYSFEAQIGKELSEFMLNFQPQRDGLWTAQQHDQFLGSIAIDGRRASGDCARLRWFIVSPDWQGTGLGRSLMQAALQFCQDKQFDSVCLWTFAGLEAAHHLYAQYGFRLVESHEVKQWGQTLEGQKYLLEFRSW